MQLWAWKSIQAIRFSCGKDFDSMIDVNYFFVDTFLSEQGSKSADVRVAFWSKNSSGILYSTIWRSYMFCKYGFEKLVFCLEFIAKRNKVRGNRVNFQSPQRIYFNILSSAHFLVASNWGKAFKKDEKLLHLYLEIQFVTISFCFPQRTDPENLK